MLIYTRMKLPRALAGAFSLLVSSSCYAIPHLFTATLSGLNEVPANVSPGTGWANVTYDPALHTLAINASFSNLLGLTTASHIHAPAFPGSNAGVATQTPTFVGFPLGVTSGIYSNTLDLTLASSFNAAYITANGGTAASAEAALAAALFNGAAYFNIHTNLFQGGEVRGNLALAVPDGGTVALMLIPTFLALTYLHRRRTDAVA
jgi:hypothetical protein